MDAHAADPSATPDPQALAAVTAQAARFQAEGGQPGIAFGVVAGGRLVHSGGFGERRQHGGAPPDAHTGLRIASMTKSFTASVLLLLRDEGALRLDDPVAEHVPAAAQLRGPTMDSPPITIRHLLTMAAGFPTDDPWGDRQQGLPAEAFTELVRGGLSFAWAPGTAFEYSNLGYALLGLVIESCTGSSYRGVVTQRLLEPLGMTSTGFDETAVPVPRRATGHRRDDGGWRPVRNDPCGAFAPMGGLFSTVADLARWVAGFTDAFPPRDDPEGGHPLTRTSRRELQQPHRGLPAQLLWPSVDAAPTVRATGYGFGLLVEHDPVHGLIVGHSGGYPGFGSHMRWHPGTGLGVVLLGNATYTPTYRPAARMLSLLLAGAAHPPRRSRRVPGGAGTASLTGVATRGVSSGQVQPAPAGEESWAATRRARAAVERLLHSWDDALAADVFADNVDLDRPLAERRAELERIRERFGPLEPHPGSPTEQPTPAQCSWWMRGPGGRVRLDILLTPQLPPRIQTLTVTPAAQPSARLLEVAELIVAELARPCPQWPPGVATSRGVDPARLTRLLQVAAAWSGACDIVAVTAGDGDDVATFRLAGERGELGLSLTVELEPPPPDRSPRPVRRLALAVDT
jgi:CubicO group peptidase (beta-lactamase class C family)